MVLKRKFKKNETISEKETKPSESSEPDSAEDSDLEIPDDQVEFNMPKPGPHAKAGEWRKWKLMKRKVRQMRSEKRMIKHRKLDEEHKEMNEKQQELSRMKPTGRKFTISIAVPSSIMAKQQSRELKTYFAGQVARAAALFCVDEIVIYNEYAIENKSETESSQQFVKILEYLECPQYLRKSLFPPNKHLEHVGLLNPLEALHHLRKDDEWEYREGVVTDIPSKENKGSWVDIGLYNKIQVDKKLQSGIRVTVKKIDGNLSKLRGLVVSPEMPRTQSGIYWGYQVRYATSFRKILSESTFKSSYEIKIGVDNKNLSMDHIKELPRANHYLIVYGGIEGIGAAVEADEKLKANRKEQIFNYLCQPDEASLLPNNYGSRTIRLEESLLVTLSFLRSKILDAWNDENAEVCRNSAEIEVEEDET